VRARERETERTRANVHDGHTTASNGDLIRRAWLNVPFGKVRTHLCERGIEKSTYTKYRHSYPETIARCEISRTRAGSGRRRERSSAVSAERRSEVRLESPFAVLRECVALTSCARGCWWSQCRCSNIPLTGPNTAHTASRTASGDTPVPRRIFNRTRAAITDNTRGREAWHILSAPAGAAHLYSRCRRGGRQRRATHVRYPERGGGDGGGGVGGSGGGGSGTPTMTTATTTTTATLSLG